MYRTIGFECLKIHRFEAPLSSLEFKRHWTSQENGSLVGKETSTNEAWVWSHQKFRLELGVDKSSIFPQETLGLELNIHGMTTSNGIEF